MPGFAQSGEYYPAVIVPKYLVDKVPMISEQLQMPVFVLSEPSTENIQPPSFTPEPSSFPTTQFLPNFENSDNLKTNDTKESNPEITNYTQTLSSFTSRVKPLQDSFSTQQVPINFESSVQNQSQSSLQPEPKFSPQPRMNQQSSQYLQSSKSNGSPESPQSLVNPNVLVNPQQMPKFKDYLKDSKTSVNANDPMKSAMKSSDAKKKDSKSSDMDNGIGDLLTSLVFLVLLI